MDTSSEKIKLKEYKENKFKTIIFIFIIFALIFIFVTLIGFVSVGFFESVRGVTDLVIGLSPMFAIMAVVVLFVPVTNIDIYDSGIEYKRFKRLFIPWGDIIAIHFDPARRDVWYRNSRRSAAFRIESKLGWTGYIDPTFMNDSFGTSSVEGELLSLIKNKSNCAVVVGGYSELKVNKYMFVLVIIITAAFVYIAISNPLL